MSTQEWSRGSGILASVTSLPGQYGVGDLGAGVEEFVAFLSETRQSWWQILPVGPTASGNSPYSSPSSWAGNSLLLSPDRWIEKGWLDQASAVALQLPDNSAVADYEHAAHAKEQMLREAFGGARSHLASNERYASFVEANRFWLDDYALFVGLSDVFKSSSWNQWPDKDLVRRDSGAVKRALVELQDEIEYQRFVQFEFHQQWQRLGEICEHAGVRLIGDIPIYCALDSAEVWARQDLFRLQTDGRPLLRAGVPPDYFQEDGQLWGNPIYDWPAHEAEGYQWWLARLEAALDRVDALRLDHFRGFEKYWAVDAEAPTARDGRWLPGPGASFLGAIQERKGALPLIAEDLGVITPAVDELRKQFALPGMRVLQFGFGSDAEAPRHLPHNYPRDSIVYTGTHDNDTVRGWFDVAPSFRTDSAAALRAEREFACRYLASDGREIHWDMIRAVLASVADTAVLPLQDVLGLGAEARMNVPGVGEGQWRWRFATEQLTDTVRQRLREMTLTYSRERRTNASESGQAEGA